MILPAPVASVLLAGGGAVDQPAALPVARHARGMAADDYFDHQDAQGRHAGQRALAEGDRWRAIAVERPESRWGTYWTMVPGRR